MAAEVSSWNFTKGELETMNASDFLEKMNLDQLDSILEAGEYCIRVERHRPRADKERLDCDALNMTRLRENFEQLKKIRNQMRAEDVHVGVFHPSDDDTHVTIISKMSDRIFEAAGVPSFKNIITNVSKDEHGKFKVTVEFITMDDRKFWMNTPN